MLNSGFVGLGTVAPPLPHQTRIGHGSARLVSSTQ